MVVTNASNLTEQLDEAFAGGSPPDVFYLSSSALETFAKQGELLPYASLVAPASDFYPSLVQAYTYNKTWYCVPKDFSNLAVEINTTMWKAAGLTNADLPTTWAKLQADAKKLTTEGVTGLAVGDTLDRLGAFFAENGGSYMNKAGTSFAFNSPQNIKALEWVQSMAKQGILQVPRTTQFRLGRRSLRPRQGGHDHGGQLDHRCDEVELPEDQLGGCPDACRPQRGHGHAYLHQLLGHPLGE